MARAQKRDREPQEQFQLPDDYVPMFSMALPEWASNVSQEVAKEANTKGSPGFEPGPEQAKRIEQMVALGLSDQDISSVLRIEQKLLRKFYKYELETARARINQSVAKIALQMALSGSLPEMTKFWLKTQAGWKETKVTEITGKDGNPIEFRESKQRLIESIEAEIMDVA